MRLRGRQRRWLAAAAGPPPPPRVRSASQLATSWRSSGARWQTSWGLAEGLWDCQQATAAAAAARGGGRRPHSLHVPTSLISFTLASCNRHFAAKQASTDAFGSAVGIAVRSGGRGVWGSASGRMLALPCPRLSSPAGSVGVECKQQQQQRASASHRCLAIACPLRRRLWLWCRRWQRTPGSSPPQPSSAASSAAGRLCSESSCGGGCGTGTPSSSARESGV